MTKEGLAVAEAALRLNGWSFTIFLPTGEPAPYILFDVGPYGPHWEGHETVYYMRLSRPGSIPFESCAQLLRKHIQRPLEAAYSADLAAEVHISSNSMGSSTVIALYALVSARGLLQGPPDGKLAP